MAREPVDKRGVLGMVEDLVSDLLYYDRKEDEEVGVGDIDAAVRLKVVTVDEMVARFREQLEAHLQ